MHGHGHCGRGGGRSRFRDIPEAILAMTFGPGGFRWGGRGSGGEWGDWGGGRGRGRRRMFDSGELRLVLLKLIVDQPRHGYDLMRAIEELTGGGYSPSPGVVYPTLTMLEDMGLISTSGEAGGRKAFAATDEGRAHLEEHREEVDALFERLGGVGEHQRRAGGGPIMRAVGNLMSAVWHRVTGEELSEERLHEIAAILDDAAQRIEKVK